MLANLLLHLPSHTTFTQVDLASGLVFRDTSRQQDGTEELEAEQVRELKELVLPLVAKVGAELASWLNTSVPPRPTFPLVISLIREHQISHFQIISDDSTKK